MSIWNEISRSPAVRWALGLAVAIGVGCFVWIGRITSDVEVQAAGFAKEDHPVFRANKPVLPTTPLQKREYVVVADPTQDTRETPYDWPAMFGPTANSVSPSQRVLTEWPATGPQERWRRERGRGYSSPVVRGDTLVALYRQGDEEVIEAVDVQTGKQRWEFRYPTTYTINVHFSDGPYSTPALDDKFVYAWGAQGTLRCLSLTDGKLVWQRNTSEDFEAVPNQFPVASSPVLEDGKVILNVGGRAKQAGIVALDVKTGETLWTATDHLASYATPVAATMHGKRFVFVFTQTGLVALDPRDGHIFWTVPYRSVNQEFINTTSPLVVGNYVVLSGWALGALCIEVLPDGSYAERWRDRRGLDSQFVNLVSDGKCVYGCAARDSTYRCVDLKTGKVRWAWSSDIIGRGAYSIVVGNRAILFGEPGQLTSLELGGDEPVVRAMTAEGLLVAPNYTMPALSNGLLFLRNESTLCCFDLRIGPDAIAMQK